MGHVDHDEQEGRQMVDEALKDIEEAIEKLAGFADAVRGGDRLSDEELKEAQKCVSTVAAGLRVVPHDPLKTR